MSYAVIEQPNGRVVHLLYLQHSSRFWYSGVLVFLGIGRINLRIQMVLVQHRMKDRMMKKLLQKCDDDDDEVTTIIWSRQIE